MVGRRSVDPAATRTRKRRPPGACRGRAPHMDLRLTRPRKRRHGPRAGGRGCVCLHAGAGGGCSGRYRSLGGAEGRAARGGATRAAPPPSVRLGAASARSSPVPAVRRAGLSPQAPGGGGEPRAARPRADAAARSRSVPEPPPPRLSVAERRRRARSLARAAPPAPSVPLAPRLRPVFLWARQTDGTVQEVRCEDYDSRNRIRIARTATGWRAIPRTEIYDAIRLTELPRERTERRRRRRCVRDRRSNPKLVQGGPWVAPDLESHIPSHTIAIPRIQVAPSLSPTLEPVLSPFPKTPVEPVLSPFPEPAPSPPLEPALSPPLEPVQSPPLEPVLFPFPEPVLSPPLEPVRSPFPKPVPSPPLEPVLFPFPEPVLSPPLEPVLSPPLEPVGSPFPKPVPSPPLEPVLFPFPEPVLSPPLEPALSPFPEPVPSPPLETVLSPFPESVPSPPEEPALSPFQELAPSPSQESVPSPSPEPAPSLSSEATLALDPPKLPPPATTAVPTPPLAPPAVPEPTPMDNLLAVAELELELQSGALPDAPYPFPVDEQVARDVMSFDLGEHAQDAGDDSFPNDMVSHKDLFESISEAHYLPELSGPHDEALLESLVEKGCEDNQILDRQTLDKLTHLVTASGEYAETEDILLGDAPVSDIIDRLDSLGSPGRSSMTAAQGLLHLHHIGDHLPSRERAQSAVDGYLTTEAFAPETVSECPLETLSAVSVMRKPTNVNLLEYEQNAEKRLHSNSETDDVYADRIPDINETYEENEFEGSSRISPPPPEMAVAPLPALLRMIDTDGDVRNDDVGQDGNMTEDDEEKDYSDKQEDPIEDQKPDVETLVKIIQDPDKPTDLSIMYIEDDPKPASEHTDQRLPTQTDSPLLSDLLEKPRDLTIHRRLPTPHASPRRIETPRAPSRESDAMQSPQPSGIPVSSPELFQPPSSKSKTQSILDAMFTSAASPKMYLTSEVSITKQHREPASLGKHRKSASPTVSSCSEEKINKVIGEPLEKKSKLVPMEEIYQITQLLSEQKKKRNEKAINKKAAQELSSLKQFQSLKTNKNFNIPDVLLIPRERLKIMLEAPGREIPALLMERPELRYYEDLDHDCDPDILIMTIKEFEDLLIKDQARRRLAQKTEKSNPSNSERVSTTLTTTTAPTELPQSNQSSQPKQIPSMGALAEEIDAANTATLNPMMWLQCAQMEAAMNASGYTGTNYSDLSQILMNHHPQLMNTASFPMLSSQMEYERMRMALWQENARQTSQRRKSNSAEAQMKEAAAKTSEFQSPYVHSTNKNYQGRSHTAARTSPIANNYSNQRVALAQHSFLQGLYPGLGGGVRASAPNLAMGGLNVPYFNPQMSSQRSPRTQHKSPTPPSPSAYYANNNYLQSLKANEAAAAAAALAAARASLSPAEVRPRISVKKVDELRRRRDETEVGSTTPLCEPPLLPQDSSAQLWHPLFGNQKNYTSPWSWTTVTATGD